MRPKAHSIKLTNYSIYIQRYDKSYFHMETSLKIFVFPPNRLILVEVENLKDIWNPQNQKWGF